MDRHGAPIPVPDRIHQRVEARLYGDIDPQSILRIGILKLGPITPIG
jgi:hypothetical protein